MDGEPPDTSSKTWVLSNKQEDGTVDVVAQFERLPSGAWKWTIFETAGRLPSSGVESTIIEAKLAVERIAAPEALEKYRFHMSPKVGGGSDSHVEHIFVGTDEIKNLNTQEELRPLFAAREVEADTRILREWYTKIEDIPVLRELWVWEGVEACSLIIPKKYLRSLQENDVLSMLRQRFEVPDDNHTFSNNADSDFVFINYDFLMED